MTMPKAHAWATGEGIRWKALRRIAETMNGRGIEWWPIRNEPETEPLGLYFNNGEPPDKLTLLAVAEKYEVTIEVDRAPTMQLRYRYCIYVHPDKPVGVSYVESD